MAQQRKESLGSGGRPARRSNSGSSAGGSAGVWFRDEALFCLRTFRRNERWHLLLLRPGPLNLSKNYAPDWATGREVPLERIPVGTAAGGGWCRRRCWLSIVRFSPQAGPFSLLRPAMAQWSGSRSPSQGGLNVPGTQILRGASLAGQQLTAGRVSQGLGPGDGVGRAWGAVCLGKSSASTKSPRARMRRAAFPPPTLRWRGKALVPWRPASFKLDRTFSPGSGSPDGAGWFRSG